jgi:hypothetical protein
MKIAAASSSLRLCLRAWFFPFDFGFFLGRTPKMAIRLMRGYSAMSQRFPVARSNCRLAGVLLARQVDKGETRGNRMIASLRSLKPHCSSPR